MSPLNKLKKSQACLLCLKLKKKKKNPKFQTVKQWQIWGKEILLKTFDHHES